MLCSSGAKPSADASAGRLFAKRNEEHVGDDDAEITIGSTKTARRAILPRIFDVSAIASRNATAFTRSTVTREKPMVNRYACRIAGSENTAT